MPAPCWRPALANRRRTGPIAKQKMPRIGSHQVPARTLLLIGVDSVAFVFILILASALRLRGTLSMEIGEVTY